MRVLTARNCTYCPSHCLRIIQSFCLGVLILLIVLPVQADSVPWQLPIEVSDYNTKVSFAVHTTWHWVHGKISNLRGRVWLENPSDYRSLRAEIFFPIASYETQNKSRNKKLREIMAVSEHPDSQFVLRQADSLCPPHSFSVGAKCDIKLQGELAIRGRKKAFELPAFIERTNAKEFQVSGKLSFDWASFGIPDPSFYFSKVDKNVEVTYSIKLPASQH